MKLTVIEQGRIQDFKLGVGALKKIAPRRGRHKIFGVFRVKITILRQQNLIFSYFRGGMRRVRPPGSAPVEYIIFVRDLLMNGGNSFHGIKNKSKHTTLSA
jgi:hypothetical protein